MEAVARPSGQERVPPAGIEPAHAFRKHRVARRRTVALRGGSTFGDSVSLLALGWLVYRRLGKRARHGTLQGGGLVIGCFGGS
jgi:hypothetical protein